MSPIAVYKSAMDQAARDRQQALHDAKWEPRMENFEALIKGLALGVIALSVIFILAPAVWAIATPFWRGIITGAAVWVPIGLILAGILAAAGGKS